MPSTGLGALLPQQPWGWARSHLGNFSLIALSEKVPLRTSHLTRTLTSAAQQSALWLAVG